MVNVTLNVSNNFEHLGIKYINVKIDDTPEFKISKYFSAAFTFIDEVLSEIKLNQNGDELSNLTIKMNLNEDDDRDEFYNDEIQLKNKKLQHQFCQEYAKCQNNNKILVHCSLGVSRSPTIVLMYLMKKFQQSFKEVLL